MPTIQQRLEKYYWLMSEGPRFGSQITHAAFNISEYSKIEYGSGKPTVVIPGFSASNSSMFFLRNVLAQKNHDMHKWCVHRNMGFSNHDIAESIIQVKKLADDNATTVNIVGHSLGGCYARLIANAIPEYVNVIVTMGAPITGIDKVNLDSIANYNSIVGVVDAASLHHEEYRPKFFPNPNAPSTSIFSTSDGVVHWDHSMVKESDVSENVEVDSGHFGMAFHLDTIRIVANRLSKDANKWEKWG